MITRQRNHDTAVARHLCRSTPRRWLAIFPLTTSPANSGIRGILMLISYGGSSSIYRCTDAPCYHSIGAMVLQYPMTPNSIIDSNIGAHLKLVIVAWSSAFSSRAASSPRKNTKRGLHRTLVLLYPRTNFTTFHFEYPISLCGLRGTLGKTLGLVLLRAGG